MHPGSWPNPGDMPDPCQIRYVPKQHGACSVLAILPSISQSTVLCIAKVQEAIILRTL